MATKKAKRLEMQDRRRKFEEEQRQSGLKAQKRDREYRARKRAKAEEEAAHENQRLESVLASKKTHGKQKVKDG